MIQVSVIVAVVISKAFLMKKLLNKSSNMINERGSFCYNNESEMATKPDRIDLTTSSLSLKNAHLQSMEEGRGTTTIVRRRAESTTDEAINKLQQHLHQRKNNA